MTPKVFFTKDLDKVYKLFDAAGLGKIIEKDDYVFENGDLIKHVYDPFKKDRGAKIGGYAKAYLSNNTTHTETMTMDEINGIRNRVANQYVWKTDTEEMERKTLLNRLFKSIPKLNPDEKLLNLLKFDAESGSDTVNFEKEETEIVDYTDID